MQLIYGRKAISGPRTIRTLDPIIQTRRCYMHVRVRGRPWRKKRERKKKNPYFIAALSYSSPSTLRVCTFRNSISILFVPPRAEEEEEEVDEKRKTLFRG